MDGISEGRRTARQYVTWGILTLLGAGCTLSILSAYDAAYDGAVSIDHVVWDTHAWLTLSGWAMVFFLGLVGWLLPILKQSPVRFASLQRWSLLTVIVATLPLAAHPLLQHLGRPALFLPPVGWSLMLAVAIAYAAMVWRISGRSLRPSTADVGIQTGTAWLIGVLVVRLASTLGGLLSGRSDYLSSSDLGFLVGASFGFVVNTGLGLASALLPEFLHLPRARPQVQNTYSTYNVLLIAITGGLVWCLPFPYSWGRFLLVTCAFAFMYYVFHLLSRLHLLEVVFAEGHTLRQGVARLALATGLVCLILAGVLVAVSSAWIAGTVSAPPADLLRLCVHLVGVGFFLNLVLALMVPLLGPDGLRGARGVLAIGAYALLALWTVARIAITILGLLRGQDLWYERTLAGALAGGASLALGLWLLWGFAALGRTPRRPADATEA